MKSGRQKLKKFLAFVMTAVMMLTAVPLGGLTFSASAENEGYYTYTVENGEASITDCDESISGDVVIPDTLGGYPVTSIGDYAFYDCTGLTSITIPSNVTSIGDYAFYYCTGLTSITIPSNVTSIGDYAFYDCTGLTKITVSSGNTVYHSTNNCLIETENKTLILGCKNSIIPSDGSVTSIGAGAFGGCTGLTSVTIPDSVTSIGNYAFYDCTGLTSITIPDSVTSIGDYAFSGCTGLTSITIPDSVTSIGDYAFIGCTGLTSVTIGNSVTSIGADAFLKCPGLTSITVSSGNTVYHSTDNCLIETESKTLILGCNNSIIPSDGSVKSIGAFAFFGCTGLTSIMIPDSVTSIGDYAFSSCSGLTNITIPDSVTSIGECAFRSCTRLTNITIPDSVTSIGEYAFYDCTRLTSITIPDSVTSIGSDAFSGCTGLTSITIPDSVTSIGSGAFYGCTGLTSITIPNSVTSIGYRAFYGCTGLTSITIPDSVTIIVREAFCGCTGLTSVTIGNSVTSIGDDAFRECTGLTSITIPDSVTSIGNGAFYDTAYYNNNSNWENDVLYIGNHLIEAKDSISGAYDVKNGTKTIAERAFSYCTGLTSVTIPDSVTSIGDSAFYDCTGLTSITIPNGVTSIGDGAFAYCTGLTKITVSSGNTVYHSTNNCLIETESKTLIFGIKNSVIPSDGSVTSIGEKAFYGCTGLTSITIPDSVTSIGDYAFSNCTGLTSIIIPDSVTSIGEKAFNNTAWYNAKPDGDVYAGKVYYKYKGNMPENTSVSIKDGTKGVADDAFYGCTGLTSVSIGNSVTSIGDHAFFRCTGLTSVTIGNSVTSIGAFAFFDCPSLKSVTIPASVTNIGNVAFGYLVVEIPKRIENFKIYGYSNTAAETYANDKGFAFIALEEEHTHTYSDWVVITEATCTAEGEETRTCSVCGATETRSVVRKAHTFGEWVTTKEATVFESGERKRTCTGCGKVSENPINKVSSIKLSKTSFTYNGKVQKPTVTVKDSKGTALKNGIDYTVTSSSGCKNTGKYSVEVTFKGNYSGSKKLYFSILPQGTSIESLSASSAGFTAKWKKKTNQITGYQLQYSTSNSFKSVKTITIKKNSDTSRSVSNLKGRTKYYVRVRTYKKVGNKNYYSSWSSAKTVATKPVTGVEILSSATIYVGGSKTLSAKTYPTKVTVKWKSSNTSVAKVSSNGKVTAIKKGKATITAYFTYGGKTYKANCAVTVKSRNPKIK